MEATVKLTRSDGTPVWMSTRGLCWLGTSDGGSLCWHSASSHEEWRMREKPYEVASMVEAARIDAARKARS